jgi:hypothetical protein
MLEKMDFDWEAKWLREGGGTMRAGSGLWSYIVKKGPV